LAGPDLFSVTGKGCEVRGGCFFSNQNGALGTYDNNEQCRLTALVEGVLEVIRFETESNDKLRASGREFHGNCNRDDFGELERADGMCDGLQGEHTHHNHNHRHHCHRRHHHQSLHHHHYQNHRHHSCR
jgi:hypothetical protein